VPDVPLHASSFDPVTVQDVASFDVHAIVVDFPEPMRRGDAVMSPVIAL
jgi:hypothetical protein